MVLACQLTLVSTSWLTLAPSYNSEILFGVRLVYFFNLINCFQFLLVRTGSM